MEVNPQTDDDDARHKFTQQVSSRENYECAISLNVLKQVWCGETLDYHFPSSGPQVENSLVRILRTHLNSHDCT